MSSARKIVQVPQPKHNQFLQLLRKFQKEHSRMTKNKQLQFYSVWEYDATVGVAKVHLESKTHSGFIHAEYDSNGMITVLQSPPGINTQSILNEILHSLLAALTRLIKRASGYIQKGGGKKKGYYLKHGLGAVSSVRLKQALACLEISVDFEREARRLGIGMSYYK